MVATGDANCGTEADAAWSFEAVYTGEVLANVSGGLRTGKRYLDNLDLILTVDAEQAWGARGGTLQIYGLNNNGAQFAEELVGDLQVTSNIDAPESLRLFEAWYEHRREGWSVLAGLYDLNGEFDVNETGGLFVNSSHGIGPDISQSGRNGPSIFPISSLALRVEVIRKWITARAAILDGVPGSEGDPASNRIYLGGDDGALLIGEIELDTPVHSRIWAGCWRYSAAYERLSGTGTSNENSGWYVGGERRFVLDSLMLSVFLRYGSANGELNVLRDYFGAGLVVESPLQTRQDDSAGLAISSARTGEAYRHLVADSGLGPKSRETIWDLTYRFVANEHFALQPTIQFVDNPSATSALEDAWVLGLRIEIAF